VGGSLASSWSSPLRCITTTHAPSSRNLSTLPRPIPRPPPVTSATLPSNCTYTPLAALTSASLTSCVCRRSPRVRPARGTWQVCVGSREFGHHLFLLWHFYK